MVKKAVDGSFSDSSNSFIRQVGLAKKPPLQYCMTMVELSSPLTRVKLLSENLVCTPLSDNTLTKDVNKRLWPSTTHGGY